MQPYIPHSAAAPVSSSAARPVTDPAVQSLLGQLLMSQQQSAPGQDGQPGAEGDPIRPEATRALAQALNSSTGQQLLQMTGWNAQHGNVDVNAIMQLLNTNNPYNAEMQRQLASGAGPFPIQGSQGEGANSGRVDSGGTGGAGKADDVAMSEEVAHIKRIQATQEKNRRNQRKYRERQKAKITSSEQHIKDLTDRVETLERLNEQLATRARDLEVATHVAAQNSALAAGPDAAAAARQREVHQALARFCTQVSGEAVTEDQVRQFHFRDWRRYTQLYQDRLAVLFAAGSDLDIKARAELASLVGLKHEAERQAWTHTPQAIHKHYAMQARLPPTNTSLDPPSAAAWHAILGELQLSPDQQQRLLQTRQAALSQVQSIALERQRIAEAFQVASPSLAPEYQQLDGHVLTSAATEALSKNLQREDQLIFALLHTFWEVATPVQAARADQLCFPHLPDVLAMCTVLSSLQQGQAFSFKSRAEQQQADEAGAVLPMPTLEEQLDTLVFKEGAQGLYL